MRPLSSFTFGARIEGDFASVRPRLESALKAEGFGILTEIDFAAAMKAKLGVDREPLVILGACNPPLANRAVTANPAVAALLPCNVVLRADGDATVIEAMDPVAALGLADAPGVREVAEDAAGRLRRAVEAVEAGA